MELSVNDPMMPWTPEEEGGQSWRGYDYTHPQTADKSMALAFKYDTIDPFASVTFNFAYVLRSADVSSALVSLEGLAINAPTDRASGANVLFQVS